MLITVWGPITWYFFHALAEKVKEEHFSTEKDNILKKELTDDGIINTDDICLISRQPLEKNNVESKNYGFHSNLK